jgi:hypothetical protein
VLSFRNGPVTSSGETNLISKANRFVLKNLQPRIPAKEGQFRIIEEQAYPLRAYDSHAIKSFERAVLVAKACEDQGLFVCVVRSGRKLLSLLAAAGWRIGRNPPSPELAD